ncbi:MAG: DUF5683 domain-containing protein [Bacteroidota bacterium]|jgi:hypothetical protein
MNRFRFILLFLTCAIFCLSPRIGSAQKTDKPHSPHKAAVMSALLPGSGQAYNKKYWKIPVLYGGFAGLGYAIRFNNREYNQYKDAFKLRLDGNENTVDEFAGIYSDNDLSTLKDFYRRNRDLSIIGCGLLYILNIVDASVDAHLFGFNVSNDLSLNITPSAVAGMNPGIGVVLSFK